MARYGTLLTVIDRVIIAVFVVKILARFIVQRSTFFRDGWNIFDILSSALRSRRRPLNSRSFARCASCGSCA